MWYSLNLNKLVIYLLPTFLRKPALTGYVQALVLPIQKLYDRWSVNRTENIYKLEHTGQVCYLRGSLNDKFDPSERRIYIDEGEVHNTTYIYTEAEQDKYIYTESEGPTIWLRAESETADTGLDFVVYVPTSIVNASYYELRAHIDFYKAGGKRYSIFEI